MQRFLTKLKGKINTWISGNKNRPLFSRCCLKQQPSALLHPTPSQPLMCFSDSHAFCWLFRGLPSSGPGRENLTGSAGGLVRGVCPGLVGHGQQRPAVTCGICSPCFKDEEVITTWPQRMMIDQNRHSQGRSPVESEGEPVRWMPLGQRHCP